MIEVPVKKLFKDMSLEELTAERVYWDDKIINATCWGAALAAAAEFRDECTKWIAVRRRDS